MIDEEWSQRHTEYCDCEVARINAHFNQPWRIKAIQESWERNERQRILKEHQARRLLKLHKPPAWYLLF